MTKYIAKFEGGKIEFESKRVITHAVVVSGKCFDKHGENAGKDDVKPGILYTVSRPDLVAAAVKKSQKSYGTVVVVEVEISEKLVTKKFKRDLAILVGF